MNTMFEFLYLGNLMREKGVAVLLEACAELKNKGAVFCCHFVGADTRDMSNEDLKLYVHSQNLQECVKIHGALYNEEKERMFQIADAFVFPTYYHNECFPLVLLEAMKWGLPIISTSEGAIADIVVDGETGLLISGRSVEALVEAMQFLMDNRVRAHNMGTLGRMRYLEKYTCDAFLQNMSKILREA